MIRRRPTQLVGALLLSASLVLPAIAADQQTTQSQLQELKSEMSKLQKMLEGFKSERSRLERDLRQSEVEIGESERRIREIEQQLQQQQQELEQLRQRRETLHQSRAAQQEQIARQVRGAYQLGREDRLKTLLNQEDPAQLSRALVYYDYFNRARSEQIEAYIDLIAELDTLEPAIAARTDSLRGTRATLDSRRQQLLSAREERQRALARLASTIKSKDDELKQLAQDRSALEAVLRKLEQAAKITAPPSAPTTTGRDTGPLVRSGTPADQGRPFRELRGQLPWPVTGRPSNRFGTARSNSDLKWQGINIVAPEGTTVQAIHGGTVVFADWLRGSGLLIIIDHGGGFMSLYAHNQSLLRKVGDKVKGGDAIATVGNSGGQEQAALYFEIRQRGVPADPAQWCRRA